MFRAVSPSIIRSSRTVHTASGMCSAYLLLPLAVASNEIFSPSNKIHREVGRAKDLSAPRYKVKGMEVQNDIKYYVAFDTDYRHQLQTT